MTDATMTDEARELYSRATTASLTAQLVKRGLRTRGISNITPVNPNTTRVFGPAYTLRYIPMREDLATGEAMADPENPQRKAIEVVEQNEAKIQEAVKESNESPRDPDGRTSRERQRFEERLLGMEEI